ncbi:hypothetical protein B9Z36_01120 [Limnohabitans sp. Rim8]|uniref:Uncharacterized protein n=1 Tax=Limnohabitans curvus TaxID=323423 RepID=A0A315ESA0_9BURK|nr:MULTISPECIES: DUF6691 family protein [Limnohabitans]PUE58772.1 hypothetical protein B9Z44_03680 [Limnohabitans curvus]PUE61947.1 hypothetical protein B9Z36_01120 [Limnohabitans sp. Rim8]
MQRVIEFVLGLTFGLGLLISGMTDPGKVQGFLDLAGAWDPSLAFVMGGGVMVGLVGFGLAKKKTISFSGAPFHWPEMTPIDRPLVLGSLMFGMGWGLAGFCPGPALVAMASGNDKALVFVLAMLVGMALFDRFKKRDN